MGKDDPFHFNELAQLAIKYKDQGVCGFGVLGEGRVTLMINICSAFFF